MDVPASSARSDRVTGDVNENSVNTDADLCISVSEGMHLHFQPRYQCTILYMSIFKKAIEQ